MTFKTPGEGEPVKLVERVVPIVQSEVSVATTATAATEITEETIEEEEEEEEDDEKEENSRQQTDHLSTSPASSVDINVTPKPPPTVQVS